MLMVIIIILVFLSVPNLVVGQLSVQEKIRQCCPVYLANNCPDDVAGSNIMCPCKITCDATGICTTQCDGYLIDYLTEIGWDVEQLKRFCQCR